MPDGLPSEVLPTSAKDARSPSKNMAASNTFTDEIGLRICKGIACGLSVNKSCAENDLHPSTFWEHLAKNEKLSDNYARAREARADARAESIDDLSQRVIAGEIDPQAARVAMDAQKWLTARENPKRYGEKLDVTGVTASSVNVLLSTRDKLKRLKRAREEGDAPAAIEGGGVASE
jgi:hypothetical protein